MLFNKKWMTISFFLFLSLAAFLFNQEWLKDKQSLESNAVPAAERLAWQQEKTELEQKISDLKKENEALKKQLTEGIFFEIPPGMSSMDLAASLYSSNLIDNTKEFHKILLSSNAMDHIVPGKYMIAPGSSYEVLIEQLTKGIVKVR